VRTVSGDAQTFTRHWRSAAQARQAAEALERRRPILDPRIDYLLAGLRPKRHPYSLYMDDLLDSVGVHVHPRSRAERQGELDRERVFWLDSQRMIAALPPR
jgi:hypothetical protein